MCSDCERHRFLVLAGVEHSAKVRVVLSRDQTYRQDATGKTILVGGRIQHALRPPPEAAHVGNRRASDCDQHAAAFAAA